ncbi:carboxymuconolactone decarboxylase family protein [Bradyrhizobium sp. B120]|uniref:carboxymuconolactone decarboxylase family protein n=1 Tax=Bradyrhizobium sp. B120 TaxID=3410088 RepID=UPI003B9878DB
MLDWKQEISDVNARLKELGSRTPDTLKGAALLGVAGARTNHLDARTRELIALAVAVTTRCDGCIAAHAAQAVKLGIGDEEIAEALGVAINLNAGAALVYSSHALDAVDRLKQAKEGELHA